MYCLPHVNYWQESKYFMKVFKNIIRNTLLLAMLLWVAVMTPADCICYYPKCVQQYYSPCCEVEFPSIWLHADALYWGAYEDGLKLSNTFEDEAITPNGAEATFSASEKNLHFDWSPGFRVGLGTGFTGGGGWGSVISWTHLTSQANRKNECTHKSNWRINFDAIDAIAGVEIWLDPDTNLNLLGGVSAVSIGQSLRTNVTNELETSIEDTLTDINQHGTSQFYGVGPKLGLEVEWMVKCCISVYGAVGGGILFGHTHVKRNTTSFGTTVEEFANISKSLDACQTVVDAAIGVRWNRIWLCGFNVALQLGFEHHQFFNHNKISDCGGDLYFDGLVGSIRFGF